MHISFTWDRTKSRGNLRKHGIGFEEASTAFGDPLSLTIPDPDHSEDEARWQLIGLTKRGRLVVVAHIEMTRTVRIISARLATRNERKTYEEG